MECLVGGKTAELAEERPQSSRRRSVCGPRFGPDNLQWPAQPSQVLGTAVRIGLMSGRAIRIASRIAFLSCGLISLFTGVPYVMLQGVELPVQSEWIIFAMALALVGVFSVTVAVLPRSWVAKACRKNRDDEKLFSAPLKLLGAFAA